MTTETRNTTLHISRCNTCLQRYATETRVDWGTRCICGGAIIDEGQINGGRLISTYNAPACDDRCQSAMGTKCNCQCQGKNHGNALLTKVVRIDRGSAPVIQPLDAEASCKRAGELAIATAAAWEPIEARYPGARATRQAGGRIESKQAWWAVVERGEEINRALKSKVHETRISKLAAIAASA